MKRNCNLFSFFARGVTATHPLCSVFILSLIFVFCSFSISVRASVSNIPELNGWQFQQAINAYSGLTDDQKDIANFLTGAQGYAFAGIANNNLNSNFSSFSETIESAKNFGAKMWDQITSFGTGVANDMVGVTNDLSNFFASAVTYAKTRTESFSAWLGNVGIDYNSSSEFRIQFGKDQAQNNIDFYGDKGLYQWQYSTLSFLTLINYISVNLTGVLLADYNSIVSNYVLPVRFNDSDSNYSNSVSDIGSLSAYHNLFINTSNSSFYLVDDSGLKYSGSVINFPSVRIVLNSSNNPVRYETFYRNSRFLSISYSYNPNSFTSYIALARYIFNNFTYSGSTCFISDFVSHVFVGSSWDNAAELFNIEDLNLTSTSQYTTVNSPINVIYLDINGFMHDLYDNPTIIYNYVIDNSVNVNGDPVDSGDFNPISKYITIPSSGISIGSDFFKLPSGFSLFDTYIADLWRNTKDMVIYCADILNVFTPDEGVGLAYIVYGGIAVGVIGGIFSKFLL